MLPSTGYVSKDLTRNNVEATGQIADDLNVRNILRHEGGPWTAQSVLRTIQNPSYLSARIYSRSRPQPNALATFCVVIPIPTPIICNNDFRAAYADYEDKPGGWELAVIGLLNCCMKAK